MNISYHPEVSPKLLLALIWQESWGEQGAHNPEQRYSWFWDCKNWKPFRKITAAENSSEYPPEDFYNMAGHKGIDADAEWWDQQSSWGLCQLMGAVARENGFRGKWLTQLVIEPELNVRLACSHFARKLKQAGGDLREAALKYNGGGNPNYPRELLEKLEEVEAYPFD